MMSLMSNVSDVKDLRPRLMEDKFIKVVCDVLISLKDLSGVTIITIFTTTCTKSFFSLYRLLIMLQE